MENEGVRLNKYICEAGVCSRREADRLITEGKVEIRRKARKGEPENEPVRASLGDRVFPRDTVFIDGKPLPHKAPQKVYLLYNKPAGVVCTADPDTPDNVIDAVGYGSYLTYAGRLDKDSEGLLVMTNDGDLIEQMMRGAARHEKEYVVSVNKSVTAEFLARMAGGVKILLDDEASMRKAGKKSGGKATKGLVVTTRPCRVKKLADRKFSIVLTQGYNRQIRRMCRALGYGVNSIRRTRVVNLTLGDLKQGEWRHLTLSEINALREALERPEPDQAQISGRRSAKGSHGAYGHEPKSSRGRDNGSEKNRSGRSGHGPADRHNENRHKPQGGDSHDHRSRSEDSHDSARSYDGSRHRTESRESGHRNRSGSGRSSYGSRDGDRTFRSGNGRDREGGRRGRR